VGVDGCIPSLRLKACRRGEQDVEYFWLLAQRRGLDRRQSGALTLGQPRMACETQLLDREGPRFERPTGLTYDRLDRCRTAVARRARETAFDAGRTWRGTLGGDPVPP